MTVETRFRIIGVFDPNVTPETVTELSNFAYTHGLHHHDRAELWVSQSSIERRRADLGLLSHALNDIGAAELEGDLVPGPWPWTIPDTDTTLTFFVPKPKPITPHMRATYQLYACHELACVRILLWSSPLGEVQ